MEKKIRRGCGVGEAKKIGCLFGQPIFVYSLQKKLSKKTTSFCFIILLFAKETVQKVA
jgi:hypothetical protein